MRFVGISFLPIVGLVALVYGAAVALDAFGAARGMPNWLQGWGASSIIVRRIAGAAIALAGAVALLTTQVRGC